MIWFGERMAEEKIWQVSEISSYIQYLLEENQELAALQVRGEVANFHHHKPSGHFYFNLSDNDASLHCVLFDGISLELPFKLENGIEIIAEGRITTYPPRSQYQLRVTNIRPYGLGTLYQAFENIKEKLAREGLFEEIHKKPLPKYPATIGLITSPVGAAIKDVVENLKKRYPLATLLVSPALVQGAGAVQSIRRALERLLALPGTPEKPRPDLIIIARGGGTFEELFVFNDESLAREIFASPIPIVTGIGHQKDFTIADFVADLRAGTPSHAVELSVPDQEELKSYISNLKNRLTRQCSQILQQKTHRLQVAIKSRFFHKAEGQLDLKKQQIDDLLMRLWRSSERICQFKKEKLLGLKKQLDSLSPLSVLNRGFSICLTDDGKRVISSINQVELGEEISTRLKDGRLFSTVRGKTED